MLRIKICGITNIEDAQEAVRFGADALGFVFSGKSPRTVNPETAREIIASLPPFVTTLGVFVDETLERIEEIAALTGIDVIQFHGSESPEFCRQVSCKFIKAIRVKDITDLKILEQYNDASAILLDTYSPETSGGTGKTFNWEIAVEAKKYGNIILAGGLNPENIEEAVKTVRPYAIDVSSGIEGHEKGKKDHQKLRLFIEGAMKAASV